MGNTWYGNRGTKQLVHICIQVDDILGEKERLAARGVDMLRIKTRMDGSLQGWIKDPDGNPVELMQYAEDSRQFAGRTGGLMDEGGAIRAVVAVEARPRPPPLRAAGGNYSPNREVRRTVRSR
jgi:hypothetical protein